MLSFISMQLNFVALLLATAQLIPGGIAGYALTDDYSKDTFFGNFTPFTETDPTNGFVAFKDYESATLSKLIGSTANFGDASYVGVDSTTTTKAGRNSMRIASKKTFNHGLFIIDLSHMPASTCGLWPAFWLLGDGTWPEHGEIDIIEGVHTQNNNQMTLHTSQGCSINKSGFSGNASTTDCGPSKDNEGCAISSQNDNSFGSGLNAIGGGVYATEWTSQAIKIWFWPRHNIPSDILSGSPNPTTWGTPVAAFTGSCNIDQHFKNMQIIFDTTFCGDWAGKKWAESGCAKSTGVETCDAYVGQNPGAFRDSYWLVNSVKVYAQQGAMRRARFRRAEG